jgi:hypothetical protein
MWTPGVRINEGYVAEELAPVITEILGHKPKHPYDKEDSTDGNSNCYEEVDVAHGEAYVGRK